MSKYVYDNHEIHEGMFVILQTLDALEGKYCGSLPDDIEELHLMIKDSEDFPIIDYFEKGNEFIDKCKLMG